MANVRLGEALPLRELACSVLLLPFRDAGRAHQEVYRRFGERANLAEHTRNSERFWVHRAR